MEKKTAPRLETIREPIFRSRSVAAAASAEEVVDVVGVIS